MLTAIYLFEDTETENGKNGIQSNFLAISIPIGETFIKYCLSKCAGLNVENIKINRDKHGKPYLDGVNNIHFNISHCANLYVFVCSNSPIGIDIEKSRVNYPLDGMKRFFSEGEWLALNFKSDNYFEFGELWSLKESYSKYRGLGLLLSFSGFSILKDSGGYYIDNGDEVYFQYILYRSIFNIAVCSKSDVRREIIKVTLDDLHGYSSERIPNIDVTSKIDSVLRSENYG